MKENYFDWPAALLLLLVGLMLFNCSCDKSKNQTTLEPERVSPPEIKTQDDRPVIAAFGNSLTAGQGVEADLNYPSQLQKKSDAEGYRYKIVNAGVSGDTSNQGLNRLQSILDLQPQIVIVELGANDGLRGIPASATRQNLETIVARLQAAGAKVVLAGMQVPPNYGPQYTGAFRNIFKDVAKRYGTALIPFFLEGVGGNATLNQEDGIHPTAAGYKIVAENVWKVLKPMLEARN